MPQDVGDRDLMEDLCQGADDAARRADGTGEQPLVGGLDRRDGGRAVLLESASNSGTERWARLATWRSL